MLIRIVCHDFFFCSVDMEEGVVSEVLKGPLGKYFDAAQLITDVSGSGNNWAVGHHFYGSRYKGRSVKADIQQKKNLI